MKIYKKIVIDMTTDEVMLEDSFEYSGELAYCGGGGESSVDKEYNRRMATIYEKQQSMADYYFNYAKGLPEEYETAQIKANIGLMPQQIGLEKARIGYETDRMDYGRKELEYSLKGLQYQQEGREQASEWYNNMKPVQAQYMKQATDGIDIGRRSSEAIAGVEHQFGKMLPELERNLSRRSLKMGSSDLRQMAINKATAKAGASTRARTMAEEEQFNRLGQASGLQFRRPTI